MGVTHHAMRLWAGPHADRPRIFAIRPLGSQALRALQDGAPYRGRGAAPDRGRIGQPRGGFPVAGRRPRILLNPSCQYGNRILGPDGEEWYNEGIEMYRLALRVRRHLVADGRCDVALTRHGETAPSLLADEMAMARGSGADVLLAIHSNAPGASNPEGRGQITFYRDDDPRSRFLAEAVHEPLLAATREIYPQVLDRGVATHPKRLTALWDPGMTSTLIEVLYHTHPLERPLLRDPSFQDRAGRALAAGLLHYLLPAG